jgi:MFS transporter, YQGE family, putative transporter
MTAERRPLSRTAKTVIFIGTGLAFSSAVSTVFVSMYLYRWLDGIAALILLNLGQFVLIPLGFAAAAPVARRYGHRAVMSVALLLFVAFYGLLVALGEESSRFLVLLGVLNGLANGVFWFSFNIIIARVSEESDKGRFYGLNGALGSAAMAAGPLVSTLAISLAPRPETGYTFLFLAIVAVSAALAIAALSLPDDASPGPIEIRRHLRSRGDKRWAFILRANFTLGLRDGANWSVMSILILQGAGSEIAAGWLAIVFALVGIGANYAVGRALTPRRYSGLWGWGSLAALASAIVIALSPSMAGASVSGILWKVAETLVYLPFTAAFFSILSQYLREEGSVAGRNIAAEILLNAGRAVSAGSFLLLSAFTPHYARILFPLLTLAMPLTWLIYRRYSRVISNPSQ